MNCKILLIDTPADIILLKESIAHFPIPIQMKYETTIARALAALDIELPDLILLGSGIIINEGIETLYMLGKTPTAVLCEAGGFNILLKGSYDNICFITRSFNLEGIPEMLNEAYEFSLSYRKESKNVLAQNNK